MKKRFILRGKTGKWALATVLFRFHFLLLFFFLSFLFFCLSFSFLKDSLLDFIWELIPTIWMNRLSFKFLNMAFFERQIACRTKKVFYMVIVFEELDRFKNWFVTVSAYFSEKLGVVLFIISLVVFDVISVRPKWS